MSESSFVKFRNRSNMSKSKSNNSLDETLESERKIEKLSELTFGDHIVVSVDAGKYCHAIVDALNDEKCVLDVIYYDDVELQCSLDEFMLNGPVCEFTVSAPASTETPPVVAVRKDSTDSKSSSDSKSNSKKAKTEKKEKEKKEKEAKEKEKKAKKEKKDKKEDAPIDQE